MISTLPAGQLLADHSAPHDIDGKILKLFFFTCSWFYIIFDVFSSGRKPVFFP
jgi:hypothetical protein